MPTPLSAALVAVVDTCASRHRLLAATLYALGCQVRSIDCDSLSGMSVGAQISAVAPDVIVWQVDASETAAPLVRLLASAGPCGAGVVFIGSNAGQHASAVGASTVQMLELPFTPVRLMNAVRAAYLHRAQDTTVQ